LAGDRGLAADALAGDRRTLPPTTFSTRRSSWPPPSLELVW